MVVWPSLCESLCGPLAGGSARYHYMRPAQNFASRHSAKTAFMNFDYRIDRKLRGLANQGRFM